MRWSWCRGHHDGDGADEHDNKDHDNYTQALIIIQQHPFLPFSTAPRPPPDLGECIPCEGHVGDGLVSDGQPDVSEDGGRRAAEENLEAVQLLIQTPPALQHHHLWNGRGAMTITVMTGCCIYLWRAAEENLEAVQLLVQPPPTLQHHHLGNDRGSTTINLHRVD
jgi:hypothetical protein